MFGYDFSVVMSDNLLTENVKNFLYIKFRSLRQKIINCRGAMIRELLRNFSEFYELFPENWDLV